MEQALAAVLPGPEAGGVVTIPDRLLVALVGLLFVACLFIVLTAAPVQP